VSNAFPKEMASQCLFIGLPLSPGALQTVRGTQARLKERLASLQDLLRWTPEESWHVTLRFIGETPKYHVPSLVAALDDLSKSNNALKAPLMAEISTGAGAFPETSCLAESDWRWRPPRVVHVPLRKPENVPRPRTLDEVVNQIKRCVETWQRDADRDDEMQGRPAWKWYRERKPGFSPHVTLFRVGDGSVASRRQVSVGVRENRVATDNPTDWCATEFTTLILYGDSREGNNTLYEHVHSISLQP